MRARGKRRRRSPGALELRGREGLPPLLPSDHFPPLPLLPVKTSPPCGGIGSVVPCILTPRSRPEASLHDLPSLFDAFPPHPHFFYPPLHALLHPRASPLDIRVPLVLYFSHSPFPSLSSWTSASSSLRHISFTFHIAVRPRFAARPPI